MLNETELQLTAAEQENYQKYLYIQELYQNQIKIDKEIELLSGEIEKLPKMPPNMERWISSFRSDFKISDLSKICKINKRYKHLMEERKINGSKIKLFAIDNVIKQIEETVSK